MSKEFEITVYCNAPFPRPVKVKTNATTKAGILRAFARATVNAINDDAFDIGAIFERAADGAMQEISRLTPAESNRVFRYAQDYLFNARYC